MTTDDKGLRAARLVPEHVQDNHLADLRNAAAVRGISVDAARAEKVAQWRTNHAVNTEAGWDLLADWLDSVQPTIVGEPGPELAIEKAVPKTPRTTRAKSK